VKGSELFKHKPTILVVDSSSTLKEFRNILGDNFNFRAAKNLDEAANLASEASGVVCEDVMKNGKSWREVFKAVEDSSWGTPLIVCSRNADERLWAEVLNYGCYDLLMKPFVIEEVTRVMNMAMLSEACA
jgi:DNA-binding NtrC family response regulator